MPKHHQPPPSIISKLIFSSSLLHPFVACAVRHTTFRVAAKPLVDCLKSAEQPGQPRPRRLRRGSSPASSPVSSAHISLIQAVLHLKTLLSLRLWLRTRAREKLKICPKKLKKHFFFLNPADITHSITACILLSIKAAAASA